MSTPTFWMDPTGTVAWGLRRYSVGTGFDGCADGYHQALRYVGTRRSVTDERGYHQALPMLDHRDPWWPARCRDCEYEFLEEDRWQMWSTMLYQRFGTGTVYVIHPSAPAPFAPVAPPGAMWNAWWMSWTLGADGISLMVRLPNMHDWAVDSEASNCTRKGDRTHKCWIRHGDPRTQRVTVDKNGETCQAGAGSIASGDYHGFLQNGVLT